MKRKNLQLTLLVVTIFSLIVLVGIQISWVLKSARMQEAQFNHTVTLAMNRIVENLSNNQAICNEMNNCLRGGNQHSCYMLMKNRMEWADLDSLIRSDLQYYNINLDYEFDIHAKDAEGESGPANETYVNDNLERILEQSGYEIMLRFPGKNEFIKAQIGYIFISSIALLLLISVSFLFIYRFYKKEKKLKDNIDDFINNITHEFKTPLTNIALANSMISKSENVKMDEKLNHYTGVIKNEQHRLREKVDLLLNVAVTEKEYSLTTEVFNALDEVRNAAEVFNVQIRERNGDLKIVTSGDRFKLLGNAEMFQVAMGNLIDNAIRYNKNNPLIQIILESEKDKLMIQVSDNGICINKEHLPRIFEKCYRVPTGDIHENEGFGLGLYYVRNTVEKMHGKIRVSSREGRGTTFSIEFPICKE